MKNYLNVQLAILLLLVSTVAYSQSRVAKIRLKNGNKLEGEVIEMVPDDYIRIRIIQGQEITLPFDQIYKFKNNSFSYQSFSRFQDGYFNYTSIGFTFLSTDESSDLDGLDWNLHTLNGYRFHSNYKVGIGIGIDRYLQTSAAPIYLGGRVDIGNKHFVPTVYANLGYAPMWEKENRKDQWSNIVNIRGGAYWELGGGLTFRNIHSNFSFNLGYKHQSSEIEYDNIGWWGNTEGTEIEKHQYRNITFTFGMTF
jgi:hypothetical protein